MQVTCIIPFFNERERIGKVLEQIIKVKEIDEIICVDDGSTDGAAEFITNRFPKIKLIINPKNLGKTETIKAGLKQTKGDCVILVDADLRNLSSREIAKAIQKFKAQKIDMLILRHMDALWTMKWVRGDILISGERILKKQDLQQILQRKIKQFQLEVAINQYMFDKRVFWMPSSARNTYKFHKTGFFQGWYEMIMVAVDIILYLGLKNYVRQLLFFCREKLV